MAQKKSKCVLPIGLLTEGRNAVVIGGGRIAYRKAVNLAASGLNVTVASSSFGPFDWKSTSITQIHSDYNSNQIKDADLVIAATNSAQINLRVLEDSRSAGALCNIVDSGWSEGDFITPAVVRAGQVTLGITTGGADCCQSRRIKDFLLGQAEAFVDSKYFSFATAEENQGLIELLLNRLNSVCDYSLNSRGNKIYIEGMGNLNADDFKLISLIVGRVDEIRC